MSDLRFERELIERLGTWVDELAKPLMPPRRVPVGEDRYRLEFRVHTPETVMIGKAVRAVSGIKAALILVDLGHVTESAALLRMVSDFCIEIKAIGEAVLRGGELPAAIQTFVEDYFTPRKRTPEEFAADGPKKYVTRKELMKGEVRMAQAANLDVEILRGHRNFINNTSDAYVHGAYETTMELCNPWTGTFMTSGHSGAAIREDFAEFLFLKLHEVVSALELAAATTANAPIFDATRQARRALDSASKHNG